MSAAVAWLRRRWRVGVLALVIVVVALVWAVFPSLLGGTPEGASDVQVADLACPSCEFVDLGALDVAVTEGTYAVEQLRAATTDGEPAWAVLDARPAELAFTVGNETQDTQVLVTDVEVEVRSHEPLSTPLVLGCRPAGRDDVGGGAEGRDARRFDAVLDPEMVGAAQPVELRDDAAPGQLRPTGLQRYVGLLRLAAPGRYEVGVRISYDTSGGASESVDSQAVTLLRVPVDRGVTMVPPDREPVCRSSRFPRQGQPALLTDVDVADADDGSVVRFAYADRVPPVRIERIEPPITEQPSGRPLDVPGTTFVAVQMAPASRVDLTGDEARQTYDGPTMVDSDVDGVAAVALAEDAGGRMTWVIGLDEPRDVVFRQDVDAVEVLLTPRE